MGGLRLGRGDPLLLLSCMDVIDDILIADLTGSTDRIWNRV